MKRCLTIGYGIRTGVGTIGVTCVSTMRQAALSAELATVEGRMLPTENINVGSGPYGLIHGYQTDSSSKPPAPGRIPETMKKANKR
jgi:hypothetical protein